MRGEPGTTEPDAVMNISQGCPLFQYLMLLPVHLRLQHFPYMDNALPKRVPVASHQSDSERLSLGPTSQSDRMKSSPQDTIGQVHAGPAPYLALPTDIVQDFEALKNATQLDTTTLMRRLLQDYTRLETNETQPQKPTFSTKLDISVSTDSPSYALLNRPGSLKESRSRLQSIPMDLSPNSITFSDCVTDDQIVMRNYECGDGVSLAVEELTNNNGLGAMEDAAPLDLSLSSRRSDNCDPSFPDNTSMVASHAEKPLSLISCDILHHRIPHGSSFCSNPPPSTLNKVLPLSSLPSGSFHTVASAVRRNNIDYDLASTASSPPAISTSSLSASVSAAPAVSYVIDLEPNRLALDQNTIFNITSSSNGLPKLSLSPATQSHENILPKGNLDNNSHRLLIDKPQLHNFPAPSKLFASTTSAALSFHNHTSVSLQKENYSHSVKNNHSHISKLLEMHRPTPISGEPVRDSKQREARALPTYYEAITSLTKPNSQSIIKEASSVSTVGSVDGNLDGRNTDCGTLLHTDGYMNVRFVPYSDFAQLSSSSFSHKTTTASISNSLPNGTETQDKDPQYLLLQKILKQQQDLFHLSQQRLKSPSASPTGLQSVTNSLHQDTQKSPTHEVNDVSLSDSETSAIFSIKENHVLSNESADNLKIEYAHDSSLQSKDVALENNSNIRGTKLIRPHEFPQSETGIDPHTMLETSMDGVEGNQISNQVLTSSYGSNIEKDTISISSGVSAAYLMAPASISKNGVNSLLAIPVIQGGSLPKSLAVQQQQQQQQQQSNPPQLEASLFSITGIQDECPPRSSSQFSSVQPSVSAPKLSEAKPKPGRPRGRGGKGNPKAAASKEMKLLTENTLFPGVYTSILKLPWSRRSRTKMKVKTVSQIRKEAQALSLAKAKEDVSRLGCVPFPQNQSIDCKIDHNSTTKNFVSDTPGVQVNTNVTEKHHILNEAENQKAHADTVSSNISGEEKTVEADQKLYFPRLEEVLRQSYVLQRTLQKKLDVPDTNKGVNKVLEDKREQSSDKSISKSQLFETTDLPRQSSPNLTPAQFQEALESSPLSLLSKITQDTPCGSSEQKLHVLCSANSGESINPLTIDISGERKVAHPSSTSSISKLPTLLGQNQVLNQTESKTEEKNKANQQFSSSNVFKMPRRRGRPPKSAIFISSNPNTSGTSSSEEVFIEYTDNHAGSISVMPEPNLSLKTKINDTGYFTTGLTTSAPDDKSSSLAPFVLNSHSEEMSLEKKISLLTHQIGLEMSRSLMASKRLQETSQRHNMESQGKPIVEENKRELSTELLPVNNCYIEENPKPPSAVVEILNRKSLDTDAPAAYVFGCSPISSKSNGCNINSTEEQSKQDAISGTKSEFEAKEFIPAKSVTPSVLEQSLSQPGKALSETLATATPSSSSAPSATTPTPRRKKVSRLLKSDGNFMYATFKIKPKTGLIPRKPRRKRKTSDTISGTNAGNAAKKKLRAALFPGEDINGNLSSSSMMSWKFHEHYSVSLAGSENQNGAEKITVSESSVSMATPHVSETCANAGHTRTASSPETKSENQFSQCRRITKSPSTDENELTSTSHARDKSPNISILLQHNVMAKDEWQSLDGDADVSNSNPLLRDSVASEPAAISTSMNLRDLRTARCMTCGQNFHKFYSDPRGSCDACLSIAPRVISSSKLFALTDSPTSLAVTSVTPSSLHLSPLLTTSTSPKHGLSSATVSVSLPVLFPTPASTTGSTYSDLLLFAPQDSAPAQHYSSAQATDTVLNSLNAASIKPTSVLVAPPACASSAPNKATLFLSRSEMAFHAADAKHVSPLANLTALSPSSSFPSSSSLSSSSSTKVTTLTTTAPSTVKPLLPFVSKSIGDLASSKAKLGRVLEKRAQRTKVSGNNLYCGLCRTEFVKICDYLSHVRETHNKQKTSASCDTNDVNSEISGNAVLNVSAANISNTTTSTCNTLSLVSSLQKRSSKLSKTKKSLAHKTLTCPVEDCPHFFREQKEINAHLVRNHPNFYSCSFQDCAFTCSLPRDLEIHLKSQHNLKSGDVNDTSLTSSNGKTADLNSPHHHRQSGADFKTLGPNMSHNVDKAEDSAITNLMDIQEGQDEKKKEEGEEAKNDTLNSNESFLNPNHAHFDARSPSDVRAHVTGLSQSEKEKPLQCELCDYRCRQKNALNWHMRKHPEAASQYRKYSVISE
ncbi:monocarboxylate transporter [Plakobranchus ocellatus]|uniref:Monocarboxylate transporter n=1 Tax=Plakobranchus ocellatus TaxID=259542 RepID=A0AAV4AJ55_9GAST|nr:monocarboxylate transporter [Plakobranchus ocellatus]